MFYFSLTDKNKSIAVIRMYGQLKEEIRYVDNCNISFLIDRIDDILLKRQKINVGDYCSIQQFEVYNNSPFFYSFYYILYYEDGQGYWRSSIDELYIVFFIKYIILFVKHYLFFVSQKIGTEIELYILSIFDQRNPHHILFRYIDQELIFLDLGVSFADVLENASFLKVFRIDVYTVFYNDTKSVFKDLYS